jgi:hypothetical protein
MTDIRNSPLLVPKKTSWAKLAGVAAIGVLSLGLIAGSSMAGYSDSEYAQFTASLSDSDWDLQIQDGRDGSFADDDWHDTVWDLSLDKTDPDQEHKDRGEEVENPIPLTIKKHSDGNGGFLFQPADLKDTDARDNWENVADVAYDGKVSLRVANRKSIFDSTLQLTIEDPTTADRKPAGPNSVTHYIRWAPVAWEMAWDLPKLPNGDSWNDGLNVGQYAKAEDGIDHFAGSGRIVNFFVWFDPTCTEPDGTKHTAPPEIYGQKVSLRLHAEGEATILPTKNNKTRNAVQLDDDWVVVTDR